MKINVYRNWISLLPIISGQSDCFQQAAVRVKGRGRRRRSASEVIPFFNKSTNREERTLRIKVFFLTSRKSPFTLSDKALTTQYG